ncbi:MAG: tyrosine-type recombinase/integrase [Candidatus Acidiferrales bacterium]
MRLSGPERVRLRAGHRTQDSCFSRIRNEWDKALQRSGVAKIRVHDMRHTVGTRLVRSGIDLRTVQEILGHASLKTTQRYYAQTPDMCTKLT